MGPVPLCHPTLAATASRPGKYTAKINWKRDKPRVKEETT
jgi:hypothetical protein